MRFLFAVFILFSFGMFAQADDVSSTVRWMDPSIDCTAGQWPSSVNPFNVYAQMSEVLKKRRPDGVLFFSVNIIFGYCSETERTFVPEGSRKLNIIATEKWPWQKLPFIKEVKSYEQTNISGLNYNKLEIRVDEKLLSEVLMKKETVKVTVNFNDFNLRGVRVRWIFENTSSGIKARIETAK